MVVTLKPRPITVDRGSRGFGLSLIYRGLDKYEEKDTGIFVARVVPGGQAARFGVKEGDKIITINGKTPRNVDDAVGVIKQAGNQIKLNVLREDDIVGSSGFDSTLDGDDRTSLASQEQWHRDSLQPLPISRSGSARSFNTTYGRNPPGAPGTPSPRTQRAFLGPQSMPSPGHSTPQDFMRQQAEYRRQQQQAEEDERQHQLVQQQLAEQQRQEQIRQEQIRQEQIRQEQIRQQLEQEHLLRQQQQQQKDKFSVKDTVRDILAATNDFGFEQPTRPKSVQEGLRPAGRVIEETKKSTENITRIVEQSGKKYKSTQSLHELGLDNYPNPEMPESTRLTRKEEKMSLQNLNNRLAGYIDRVRQLQNENHKLYHQIKTFEEYKTSEISNVKELYEKQIDDLKRALDNMNKQYNQLKVGAEGLLNENEDLKDSLRRKEADLQNAHDRTNGLEDELRNMGNKMSRVEDDHRKTQQQLKEVLPELEQLRTRLAEAKHQLDDEQLKSADLENRCTRLEEDLKFKLQLLEKELTEVKQRKEVEISEMDGKLHEEYEDRLQKALEELRDVYDKKMAQSREDFTKLYDDRIRELQHQLTSERGNNASSHQELKEARGRIEAIISKISDLEGANLALNQKIADMAQEMDDKKSAHRAQMAAKDEEIKRLLDELANQLKEYQNLQDIKIALDMEIAVFRRLIESEEDRLNIGDKSLDLGDVGSYKPDIKTSIEKHSESSYQKKITVSQTQL